VLDSRILKIRPGDHKRPNITIVVPSREESDAAKSSSGKIGGGTKMPKQLNVSDRWKEMAGSKTWVDIFEETVRKYPEKEALVFWESNKRFTYREYKERVDEIAKGLHILGIGKGTHVGIWMTNIPEWVFSRLAIYKLNGIMIPFHTRYKREEMKYVLRQSDTEILLMEKQFGGKIDAFRMLIGLIPGLTEKVQTNEIHSKDFPALKHLILVDKIDAPTVYLLEQIIEIGRGIRDDEICAKLSPQDTIHIVYTSGTTGFPKGVVTPNSCKVAQLIIYAELCDLKPESRFLNLMPFFGNIGGDNQLIPLAEGATLIVGPSWFNPEVTMKLIQNEKVTNCIFVPTMLQDIVNHPSFEKYDLSSLRRITAAGAVVPQTLIQAVEKRLGLYLMNIYGLSEASGLSTWVPYGDTPEHVEKSVGLPMPHCKVAILDTKRGEVLPHGVEGEICTREVFPGSQHMKGYYKKPELTAETIKDGWLHSGDLGRMDEDGYLYLTGRVKEMFTVGAFNVSPPEIENYILKHPKVASVAVAGVPDKRLGEVGAAFIKLKEGEKATQGEIIDFCKGNIADIKVPRYVFFVDEFPLNPQGKVQKFKLRERAIKDLGLSSS
jgi:fatty-acyl-CoA synthase